MAVPTIQQSFAAGELSPSLYGRTDLQKWHVGAATMRNYFVNFRGGASSRAGTAYVGMCKQGAPNAGGTATSNPPRDIRFQFNQSQGYALEFGDQYMRVKSNGAYVTEATTAISGVTQANPGVFTDTAHGYSNGDWIFIVGIGGMTSLNGLVYIVQNVTTNTYTLTDLFGTTINTTSYPAYTSGGTAARIYTMVTPYAAVDLPWLKFTQSADTMSLTCVNQSTNTEYPPYELVRNGISNWSLTQLATTATISAPTGITVSAQTSTTLSTYYSYVVTAVSNTTGDESVASTAGTIQNNDISVYAGSNTVTWNTVSGTSNYNVYKATPSYNVPVVAGATYGFVGSAFGTQFQDHNITADFTTVPPLHKDPFARGTLTAVTITAGGSGYSQGTVGFTVTTSTGSGFAGTPVVVSGAIVAFIITNGGKNYANGDTIAFTGGTGATGTLTVGAQIGTYPGLVSYFQQRRVYGGSLNSPNTFWMSKPGSYKNFDTSIPVVDNDAITGTPWSLQVNGIQHMVPMPSGLIVLTGSGAWQLTGGTQEAAITPSNIAAAPQAYNGISPIVPPIPINFDILFVQSKGSIVRDLSYNFFTSIYTGTDMTVLSNHLFNNHTISQWAWAEEPYKLVWAVRDDGILLSFTFLKEQDVYGWTRHDTNGLFVGVCSVTEPPVDAVYVIVKRLIRGNWVYYSERMNNRLWSTVEDSWCVDAGLGYSQTLPAATLTMDTNATTLNASTVLTTSASVFSAGSVGQVVRADGGIFTITAYTSGTQVTATVNQVATITVPNDPNNTPVPVIPGNWTIATPVTTVTGLNHLEGMTVSILADGSVSPQQTVTNGTITLQQPASSITIGLPFSAQLQSLYLEPNGPITTQGRRKTVMAVTARVETTRGIKAGSNQPDAATQPRGATVAWTDMIEVKQRNASIYAGTAIPMFTGDLRIGIKGDWKNGGQVAIQQDYPLPANILALVPEYIVSDTPG